MKSFFKKSNIDWVGMWFELLEKRGIATDVILASPEPRSEPRAELGAAPESVQLTKFKTYSHAKYDGIGAFLEHFRASGLIPTVPTLPKNYFASWLRKLLGLINNLRFVPVFGARWKAMSETPADRNLKGIYTYKVLSPEETKKVLKASRAAGVSVNSQLLWALDQSLRQYWIAGSGPFYWMIPVNMRGATQKTLDTSNHASFIWVDTLNAKTPTEIQKQIQTRFAENFHWGSWLGINIGSWIGINGMNFLLNKAEKVQEHWVGTFSNVGAWNLAADPLVIIIPTVPSSPLGAGCVTVNDRMGLSLHIHPQLKIDLKELDIWLHNWISLAMN